MSNGIWQPVSTSGQQSVIGENQDLQDWTGLEDVHELLGFCIKGGELDRGLYYLDEDTFGSA